MTHELFLFGILAFFLYRGYKDAIYSTFPYIIFALLQPQFHWDWSLPTHRRWSFLAAIMSIAVSFFHYVTNPTPFKFRNASLIFMTFYIILAYASTQWAVYPNVAYGWWTASFAKVIPILIIILWYLNDIKSFCWILITIAITIIYLNYHFNSLYFFDNRLDIFFEGHGVFDNNHAATLVAFGIPLTYLLLASSRMLVFKVVYLAILIVPIHSVMLSYSRGAMLSGIASASWLLIWHRARLQTLIFIALIPVLVFPLAGEQVRERFFSIQESDTDGSAQARIDAWQTALRMMQEYPYTGVGLRNSDRLLANYGGNTNRAIHNQYLQIGADCGIPAMITYTIAWIIVFLNLIRFRFRIAKWPDDRLVFYKSNWFSFSLSLHAIALSIESCVVLFLVNSVFLSMEGFEIFWYIYILALVMPYLNWKAAVDSKHVVMGDKNKAILESDQRRYARSPI